MSSSLPSTADAVVVGAGIVGAACALELARAGLAVVLLDRGPVGGGTTSRGEGNILVSDKGPGPELDLALLSGRIWLDLGDELGRDRLELEAKGGLVVAHDPLTLTALSVFAGTQSAAGVSIETVPADRLHDLEPHLAPDRAGAVLYPQDLQVQPVLAATAMVDAARALGAVVVRGADALGGELDDHGRLRGIRTSEGSIATPVVVNAAGTWGGEVGRRFGAPIPVLPRRGSILVTEPLPRLVRRKVYTAEYVANVASGDAGLETSTVVEGTRGGTVLIGASRERVGFDTAMSREALGRMARGAVALFPFLRDVRMMRYYTGFRPYCPDHLPVIGPDERVPGLFHACGHEGAGIGLATGTGRVIAAQIAGDPSPVDADPFSPSRFHRAQVVA